MKSAKYLRSALTAPLIRRPLHNSLSVSKRALCSGLILLVAGCANMPSDKGFATVKTYSEHTLGHTAQWHLNESSYQEAQAWVHEAAQTPLDVNTAVRIGLVYSPAMQATYANAGIAQADVVQAALIQNPGFSAAYMSDSIYYESNFYLTVSLISLITQPTRKKIAQYQLELAQQQVELAMVDFIAKTKTAYYQAIAAQQLAHIAAKLEQSALAAAVLASEQYKGGTLSLRDTAKQQLTHLEALTFLKQSENASIIAYEALISQLGLPARLSHLTLPESLPNLPKTLEVYENIDPWVIEHRLDIRVQQANLKALSEQYGLTCKMRYLGNLDLGIQNQKATRVGSATGPTIALALPIFDQGQARVARTELQVLQAQMQLFDAAAQALSQVRQAQSSMQVAYYNSHYYEHFIMPLTQVILKDTQTRQGAMLATPYELLDIFNQTQSAAQNYTQSLADYWSGVAELERAAGGILPPCTSTCKAPKIDAYPVVI
ncbi:MAG TPA: TolC family protein, partial [Opitutales bacterium]|nr:TolC family protein [Opitutales bacterium]